MGKNYKFRILAVLFTLAFSVFCYEVVFTFSSQPPAGRTGAPGESTCATGCHTGSLNLGPGGVAVSFNGGNQNYSTSLTYPVTVTVTDPTKTRMGFSITALDNNNGTSVGTFSVVNPSNTSFTTGNVGGNTRQYIGHLNANTSIATWNFNWVAPASSVGTVTFYVVGNATNGTGGTGGDNVYTDTIQVNFLPALPVANFVASPTDLCEGNTVFFNDNSNGGPTSWAWDFGDGGTSSAQNPSHPYNTPGAYTVTLVVTNAVGSDTVVQTNLVNVYPQPAVALNSVTDASCAGNDGAIDITISNAGTNPLVNWSNGATAEDISGLGPGNYTVTVTDSSGTCSATQTFTVTQPSAATLTAATTDVLCNGDSTGAIDLNITGGVAPYSYAWSNGATSEDLSVIPAGSYSITVTDSVGCVSTQTFVITEPPALAVATGSTPATTGSSDGTATATPSGGTPPYTYVWNSNPVQLTATATGLPTGNYTVDVLDSNGCAVSETVFVDAITGVAQGVADEMQLYPNPASEVLHIALPAALQAYPEISLFNLAGELVWHRTAYAPNGAEAEIPVAGLRPGVYFVRVKTVQGAATGKIMVR